MTSEWLSPPTRSELIENLVSGVGESCALYSPYLFHQYSHFRQIQSIQCRNSWGLSLPPNPKWRIRLLGELSHFEAVGFILSILIPALIHFQDINSILISTIPMLSSTYSLKLWQLPLFRTSTSAYHFWTRGPATPNWTSPTRSRPSCQSWRDCITYSSAAVFRHSGKPTGLINWSSLEIITPSRL